MDVAVMFTSDWLATCKSTIAGLPSTMPRVAGCVDRIMLGEHSSLFSIQFGAGGTAFGCSPLVTAAVHGRRSMTQH